MKRLIITGGTGGLGSAIASKFRELGWVVIALGRNDLNLRDQDAVNAYFAQHQCDLLVCAAGMIRDRPLARMDESDWNEVLEVNFTTAQRCAAAALPGMLQRGKGHVIFITSYAAKHPAVGQAAYATAKAALLGLTKSLAEQSGANGVRINAVAPGFLETPMTEAVSGKRKESVREQHYLGDFNTVAVAADFIWFLEERLPFTSGQCFTLDSRP